MLSNRSRAAAPFVVVGLIAAGALSPTLRASASPDLPAITPQHLIQKVLTEKVSHLSGTFEWRADLGLPSLSDLTGGGGQNVSSSSSFAPTSLLSGTRTFNVWVAGDRQRIAAPGTLTETDVVHSGNQAWLYDSSTNHVTHYIFRGHRHVGGSVPPLPLDGVSVPVLAADILRGVHSVGTDVSVSRPVKVAGRAAYVLRLAPDRALAANKASTVADVTIAVDATTGFPLRVSVYAVRQSSPALQVGFSSISFATPSASMFAAPQAQTTTTKVVGPVAAGMRHTDGRPPTGTMAGHRPALHLPAGHLRVGHRPVGRVRSSALGRDWGTIVTLPAGPLGGANSGQLDAVTTVVSGPWGSGRLLQSTLVNALFVDHGPVLIGLVTPAALEAAAGHLPH